MSDTTVFDDIRRAYDEAKARIGVLPPSEVEVGRVDFQRLNNYFADEQEERAKQGIKSLPRDQVHLGRLLGLKVVVDPDLKPGEIRLN